MSIAFVDKATVVNETSVTTTTISVPAGVANGHLMLAVVATSGTGPVGAPAGWTTIGSAFSQGSINGRLAYRVASSEPGSYGWTHGLGASTGAITALSGVDTASPIAASIVDSTTVDDVTFPTTALTVPAGGWLVHFPVDRRNSATIAQSWSTSVGTDVRRAQQSGSSGSGSTFSVAVFDSNGVGSGSMSRTETATQTWAQVVVWSVALNTAVQTVAPTGIASGSGVGSPAVTPSGPHLAPTGVASSAVVGEPVLAQGVVTLAPEGIASAAAFGTPTLTPGPVIVSPTGIPSQAAVGKPMFFTATFTPPTVEEGPVAEGPLFSRYKLRRGISVVKWPDGSYSSVRYPAQTDLESALAVYLGGHVYALNATEVSELTAAGYGDYITFG